MQGVSTLKYSLRPDLVGGWGRENVRNEFYLEHIFLFVLIQALFSGNSADPLRFWEIEGRGKRWCLSISFTVGDLNLLSSTSLSP